MRIKIVAVGLVVAAVIAAGAYYYLQGRGDGRPRRGPKPTIDENSILAHPYLNWGRQKVDPSQSGVVIHNRKRAWAGYSLFCSRNTPEAYLIDMNGKVVHMWAERSMGKKATWVGAHLQPDGTLLVIEKLRRMMLLDWSSKVIWSAPFRGHHDINYSPVHKRVHAVTADIRLYKGVWSRFPIITDLTPEGEFISSWASYDHMDEIKEKFDTAAFLDRALELPNFKRRMNRYYDIFHMNTITVLGESALSDNPAFRPGNLLICFRNVNQIATMDPITKEILWVWGQGELDWPHHPTLLENGNILVFDNGTRRGHSRVVEMDPLKKKIVWEYKDDPPEKFHCRFRGSSQRLPNGNTLICDGQSGRGFEVTSRGVKVWEFLHPEVSEEGHRAVMYRMLRYPTALVEGMIEKHGTNVKELPAWAR